MEIKLPEVIAHTAYYAMHHATLALFVERGLPLPKTHSGLITRLSQLDREASLPRLIADYEAEDTLTVEHARAARDEAIAFVSFCERLLGGS
ncbi:MAG: hypothetical protein Q8M19_28905 [Reyranella sp.]|nr:hypothetical protein [Reyranella sp.]